MKIFVAISLSFAVFAGVTRLPAETLVGGFAPASITDKAVQDAAAAAISAQAKILQSRKDGMSPKLELVKILAAEKQVVAGMNYRLTLRVKLAGKEQTAEAMVWWQSWRKPAPYQLTSWKVCSE